MKLFKRLIALIMVVVLMAGCTMRTNTGFKIEKEGKLYATVVIAMDNEMIDTYLSIENMSEEDQQNLQSPDDVQVKEYSDSERWAFIESDDMKEAFGDQDGFTKEKYDKDGMKGYVYTKELGTLDEVTKESASSRVNISDVMGDDFSAIKDKALFVKDGDTYKSNMKLDTAASTGDMDASTAQIKQYGGTIEMNFTVELPTKAISSNADSTADDGKTLKWDLTKDKDIDFEFKLTEDKAEDAKEDKKKSSSTTDGESSNLLLYIGIGAGVLVLLIVIIVIVVASSKKKNAAPVQPAVMAPTYGPTVQPLEPPVQPVQPVGQPAQPTEQPVQPQDPNNNNPQM